MKSESRVVVDTNIFISALLIRKSKPDIFIRQWYTDAFVLLISNKQLQELTTVLARPKYRNKYSLSHERVEQFLDDLKNYAISINPTSSIPVSIRDPKDEIILATALGGKANYLVTGDADLLVLADSKALGKLKIVTVNDFLSELRQWN